eukprot:m.474520 g.474520  ORF g.474520 m.474520 type:complete len:182 (+) comp57135_c0_seq4:421-966(+)
MSNIELFCKATFVDLKKEEQLDGSLLLSISGEESRVMKARLQVLDVLQEAIDLAGDFKVSYPSTWDLKQANLLVPVPQGQVEWLEAEVKLKVSSTTRNLSFVGSIITTSHEKFMKMSGSCFEGYFAQGDLGEGRARAKQEVLGIVRIPQAPCRGNRAGCEECQRAALVSWYTAPRGHLRIR